MSHSRTLAQAAVLVISALRRAKVNATARRVLACGECERYKRVMLVRALLVLLSVGVLVSLASFGVAASAAPSRSGDASFTISSTLKGGPSFPTVSGGSQRAALPPRRFAKWTS